MFTENHLEREISLPCDPERTNNVLWGVSLGNDNISFATFSVDGDFINDISFASL